jgi:hypothetical protein
MLEDEKEKLCKMLQDLEEEIRRLQNEDIHPSVLI